MIRQFTKDSLIYTVPSVLSKGIGFLMLPLYTRILEPSEYGILDLFLILGNIVNLTVALEINQSVAVFHAEAKDKNDRKLYVSTAMWFTLICYTLFLILSFSFAPQLSSLIIGHEGAENYFRLALVYIYLNGIFLFLQNQFRWELRSIHFAASNITMTIVTALAAFLLGYVYQMGLLGILYAMIAGVLVGCALSAFKLTQSISAVWDHRKLKSMLAFSIPLVPSSICVFLSLYIDRMMINKWMTIDDVGIYGIGIRVASIVTILISGISGSLTPLILQRHQNPETPKHISAIFHVFFALSLLMFLGSSLFAHEFLVIMATEKFYGAASVIPVLLLSTLCANMYIFTPGIFLAKKTRIVLWINVVSVIVNVVLNIILIPVIGIMGAAIGTLASSLTAFLIYVYYNQKTYPILFRLKPIIGTSVLIGMLSIIGYIHTDITWTNFAIKLIVFLGGAASLVALKLVSLQNIQEMYHEFRQENLEKV